MGNMTNTVLSGIFGLCVGDALGVPIEFISRKVLKKNKIIDMIGYGTHNQPPGTWSDDSSLTLCLAESLCIHKCVNLKDISTRFIRWYEDGYCTPYGKVFDIGNSTRTAIENLKFGTDPELAGLNHEYSNGNGSLMRILPLAYYLKDYKSNKYEVIHKVSAITHRHICSQIGCSIYVDFAINLLNGYDLKSSYNNTVTQIKNYYIAAGHEKELDKYSRILEGKGISKYKVKDIYSDGYVVNTLEASLWCLFNTNSYKDAVLTAINLGEDTDTVAAVTGGLAGIYYGIENIPQKWIDELARKDNIHRLCTALENIDWIY